MAKQRFEDQPRDHGIPISARGIAALWDIANNLGQNTLDTLSRAGGQRQEVAQRAVDQLLDKDQLTPEQIRLGVEARLPKP